MDLYKQMRNISGKSNIEELEKCIKSVKEQLSNLTEERTCKIYNGLLYKELLKNHIPAELINTRDLDMEYEHVFINMLDDEDGYVLVDLTFSQFNNDNIEFKKLLENGYQKMTDKELGDYLDIISDTNLYYMLNNLGENNKKI